MFNKAMSIKIINLYFKVTFVYTEKPITCKKT